MSGNQEIILSGIRPTGRLHFGNYFGAIKHFIDLQGWRATFQGFALLTLACMLPLALCLIPHPVLDDAEHDATGAPRYAPRNGAAL